MRILDPWKAAEGEMMAAGYSLHKIPKVEHVRHVWAEGLLFFWVSSHRLPEPEELATAMFDEWDDPVSVEEATYILDLLKGPGY